jgi:hypothetical protein
MSDKRKAFDEAIYLVWRNFPSGASTFGPCDCGRGAGRGSGPCLKCAQEKLSNIVGEIKAHRFVQHVKELRAMEEDLRSCLDK